MKIKDVTSGKVFEYGSDGHHALVISDDGRTLSFEHLQNGDGSGELGGYRFVDDNDEIIPCETEQYSKYGADSYFNIGGFNKELEEFCEWEYDEIKFYWLSSCNHLHAFGEDGPKENEYHFCPYCGKKIKCKNHEVITRAKLQEKWGIHQLMSPKELFEELSPEEVETYEKHLSLMKELFANFKDDDETDDLDFDMTDKSIENLFMPSPAEEDIPF